MNSLFRTSMSASKVRLLINFAKKWSQIEAAEKKKVKRCKSKRMQLRRVLRESRASSDSDSGQSSWSKLVNIATETPDETDDYTPEEDSILSIESFKLRVEEEEDYIPASTIHNQEESSEENQQEPEFRYSPPSPVYNASSDDEEEEAEGSSTASDYSYIQASPIHFASSDDEVLANDVILLDRTIELD